MPAPDIEGTGRPAAEPHHGRRGLPPDAEGGERAQRYRRPADRDGHRGQGRPAGSHRLAGPGGPHRPDGPAPPTLPAPAQGGHLEGPPDLPEGGAGEPPGVGQSGGELEPQLLVATADELDGADPGHGTESFGGGPGPGVVADPAEPDDGEEVAVLLGGGVHPESGAGGEEGPQPGELRVEAGGLALGVGAGGEAHRQVGAVRPHLARHPPHVPQGAGGALHRPHPLPGHLGGVALRGQGQVDRQLREAPPRIVVEGESREGDPAEDEEGEGGDPPGDRAVAHRPRPRQPSR